MATCAHHPLAEAYIRRNPPPHNRPTWDLTSVLYAVLPDRGYFDFRRAGRSPSSPTDSRGSKRQPQGNRPLSDPPARAKARVLEALVQLSSQPPSRVDGHQAVNPNRSRRFP